MRKAELLLVAVAMVFLGSSTRSSAQEKQPEKETLPALLVVEEVEIGAASGLKNLPNLLYGTVSHVLAIDRNSGREALLKSDGGKFEPVTLDDGTPVTGSSISLASSGANASFVVYGMKKDEFGFVSVSNGKAKYFRIVREVDLREYQSFGADKSGSIFVKAQWYDNYDNDRWYLLCTVDNELRPVLTPEGKPLIRFDIYPTLHANGKASIARPGKDPGHYEYFWIENGKMVPIERTPVPEGAKLDVRHENTWYLEDVTIVFGYDSEAKARFGYTVREGKAEWLLAPDGKKQAFNTPVPFKYNGSWYVEEYFRLESSDKSNGSLFKLEGNTVTPVAWKSSDKKGAIATHVLSKGCLISNGTKKVFESWTLHWLTEEGVKPIEFSPGRTMAIESSGRAFECGEFVLIEYWDVIGKQFIFLNGSNVCSISHRNQQGYPFLGEYFASQGGVLICCWTYYDKNKVYGVRDPGTLSALAPDGKKLSVTTSDGKAIEGRELQMYSCPACTYVLQRDKDLGKDKLYRIKAAPK